MTKITIKPYNKNGDRMTKQKTLIALLTFTFNVACTIAVVLFDIETTSTKVIGSYVALALIIVAAWRFPLRFYICSLVFGILASSLGSAVNLYRSVDAYDIFVHYLSGILLAEGGYLLADFWLEKRGILKAGAIKTAFAFLLSSAAAAFWEIYEFAADCFANAHMQGTKRNTMFDIVAGVLGAATHLVIIIVLRYFSLKKNSRV